MRPPPTEPVEITIPATESLVFQKGVPLELPLELETPQNGPEVVLESVRSLDGSVRINQDSLQRGVTIEPGETYRFVISITQTTYEPVNLDRIRLQFRNQSETRPIASGVVQTRPSLRREILVQPHTLSSGDLGHRTEVTFRHVGLAELHNVRIQLERTDLVAGKLLLRIPMFARGDEVSTIVLLRRETVTFHMAADTDYGDVREDIQRAITPAPPPTDTSFRLIDPARLLADGVSIVAENGQRVPERRSAFVVASGQQVRLRVRPSNHNAQAVALTGTEQVLHVLKETRAEGAWEFLVRIHRDEVFLPRQATFYYDVRAGDRARDGTVRLTIRTDLLRRLYVSVAFGLAFTLQGAWGFLRLGQSMLVMGDISELEVATSALESLHGSNAWPDEVQLAWLAVQFGAIPLILVGYTILDEVWYRLLPTFERLRRSVRDWRDVRQKRRKARLSGAR